MSTVISAIEQIQASPYPTYALRAWLTALLAQTRNAQVEMEASIRNHESEIERLRQHLTHAGEVLKSLEHSIERVDGALRKQRDVDMNRPHSAEAVDKHEHEREEDEAQKKN